MKKATRKSLGYVEITLREFDGEWTWHASRPGRPGEQSDTFPTRQAALDDALAEFDGRYTVSVNP